MTSSVQPLFLGPLVFQLLVLFVLGWIYRKRGLHYRRTPKANIYRCTQCKKVYIDPRVVPLSKCPKCNTLNEVVKR